MGKKSFVFLVSFFVTVLVIPLSCKKSAEDPSGVEVGQVFDIDGNVYTVIKIGSQSWMKENLKTTRFNNGTAIPLVTSGISWSITSDPAFCWYANNSSNKDKYGAMYNWYAVNTSVLCPEGWRVPTNNDWTILTDYLGGLGAASGKMREQGSLHWNGLNEGATNVSQFTALPGGYRSYRDGAFFSIGDNGSWWSSSFRDEMEAWERAITNYNTSDVQVVSAHLRYGVSVRCIKN